VAHRRNCMLMRESLHWPDVEFTGVDSRRGSYTNSIGIAAPRLSFIIRASLRGFGTAGLDSLAEVFIPRVRARALERHATGDAAYEVRSAVTAAASAVRSHAANWLKMNLLRALLSLVRPSPPRVRMVVPGSLTLASVLTPRCAGGISNRLSHAAFELSKSYG